MKTFNHIPVELTELKTETIEKKRYYVTPDGNKYPSITTVLSKLSKAAILEWRKRVGEEEANRISTQASRRGTKTHTLIENYVQNKQDYLKGAFPDAIQMFKTAQKVIDEKLDNIRGIEIPLYSDELKVAGRCDLIGEWEGELSIVDWKTSRKLKKEEWIENYFLQGTAYALMFEERTGIPVDWIVIVIMVDDESLPQVFRVHKSNYIERLKEVIEYECINT